MTAAHHTHAASNRRLGEHATKAITIGLALGSIGLVLSIGLALAGGEHGWERFFQAYLTAFMVVTSISLGGLFFVILQHCVKAGWSVVIRRLAEGVAWNLTWLWIAFIPIALFGLEPLYHHWLHVIDDHGHVDQLILNKAVYFFGADPMQYDQTGHVTGQAMHVPWFWLIRAALFLGIWAFLANWYYKKSVQQDETGDVRITEQMERRAPVSMLLFGLSLAFASIDWLMSLEPHWFSTMYPVYFFAASCCGFFATQILVMNWVQRGGRLTSEITPEHYQDAGKLLFAFGIVFWAYIAFSQFMLIWYANIPEETTWYLARTTHGWRGVSWLLLFGHFLGPFVAIISRHPKRNNGLLAIAAIWMLFMHFVDIYWLAMPRVPADILHDASNYGEWISATSNEMLNYGWHLLDLTCLIGLGGLAIGVAAWRLSKAALLPVRDPRLHESLAFENI